MNGETESLVPKYVQESGGAVEACVDTPRREEVADGNGARIESAAIRLPIIDFQEISAALLNQATNGFDKDTFWSADMPAIGRKALASPLAVSSASKPS